jgi:hypothetical protein
VTYTIQFRRLVCFGIVFMDGDSTNILVISGGRVDELEGDGRWVGHGSDADEITGGNGERGGRSKEAFLLMVGKI